MPAWGHPIDLRTTVGAVPHRSVTSSACEGPEARRLPPGPAQPGRRPPSPSATSAPSLLLQPTGKVDAWLRVTRTGDDEFLLDVDAGFGDAVLARLQRFKLRTKAELALEHAGRGWRSVARAPPASTEAPRDASRPGRGWPGVEGVDLLSATTLALAGRAAASTGRDLEALRIECGVPAMGAELTEATIPPRPASG